MQKAPGNVEGVVELDPKLVNTFLVLSEELSFSRAAVRLNVAQPWISERIRHLEEQAGLRLFHRTSRSVELSPEGSAFLPKARAIIETIDAAEATLRSLRGAGASRISLSTLDDYSSYPERRILVQKFISSSPETKLDIRGGSMDQIVPRLISGETDLVFASLNVKSPGEMLEAAPICVRNAYLLAPEEHHFAHRESVNLQDLIGQRLVVSPGHSHPEGMKAALLPLLELGLQLVHAPEGRRSTIEHYTRVHRLMCLRWYSAKPADRPAGDMVLLPINGNPLKTTTALWRRRGSKSPSALAFWRHAALLHRVLVCGDTEPAYRAIKSDMERPLAEFD